MALTLTPEIFGAIDRFTTGLKLLTRSLTTRCPNDATIWRAEKRIMTGIALDPLFVVNTVGSYLYKYRDEIVNFNDDTERFFMQNDFDDELKAGVDSEKVDLTAYIIPRAKEIARDLSAQEKQELIDIVTDLLADYTDYYLFINSETQ